MPLRKTYHHLNNVQIGSFGESYAKMAFTLEGFSVFSTEYDDRGVDFVVQNDSKKFFRVQVKTTGSTANPFIKAGDFDETEDFLFCAVRIEENKDPEVYVAKGSEWNHELSCLNYNSGGGNAGAYYEIRFSKKYDEDLREFLLSNYVRNLN